MLTFFTTAKPFVGHTGMIQRNALESWTLAYPHAEVILFGDDAGSADAARTLRLRYEPHVERSATGSKRLDYLFATARCIARHEILCYVNCDIVLTRDFRRALEEVRATHTEFLMVGRRWDVEVWEQLDFTRPNWQSRLQATALSRGRQRTAEWIDYFAFNRGLYGSSVPPLVVGRVHWDNWLVWRARTFGVPVVDASDMVIAVHQNHDYAYHPQGKYGVWNDLEAIRNLQICGGWRHLRTIADATERLGTHGLKANPWRHWSTVHRYTSAGVCAWRAKVWQPAKIGALEFTRPLRHVLGLRRATLQRHTGQSA